MGQVLAVIPEGGPSDGPVLASFVDSGYGLPWNRAQSWGGRAINDTSEGLMAQVWECEYSEATGEVTLSSPSGHLSVLLTRPGITELSLTFDQNMQPFLAFVQDDQAKFLWYDPIAEAMVVEESLLGDARNPRCCLDDKRPNQLARSDILLFYVRGGELRYRSQMDRFTVEYPYSPGMRSLEFFGMTRGLRLRFEEASRGGILSADDRKAMFRVTKDGGRNWGNWKERDLGEQGEYRKRVVVTRLGQARSLALAVRVSSPVKATLLGATAQITPSDS